MNKVVGVYNAEGSLKGELSYILKKLIGLGSCGLCDLTHGWQPIMKRSWQKACSQSVIDITLLHLNELNDNQRAVVKSPPVILQEAQGQWLILMTADEIQQFKGQPQALLAEVEIRLR